MAPRQNPYTEDTIPRVGPRPRPFRPFLWCWCVAVPAAHGMRGVRAWCTPVAYVT